jgi:dihydrofolate reductase
VRTWGHQRSAPDAAENDLIDEYRLFIYPVVLGSGKRLFASGTVPAALKQVQAVTTGKGATYHRLERGGKPEYGRMGS